MFLKMMPNMDLVYCTKFDWLRKNAEPIKFHVTFFHIRHIKKFVD